MGTFSRRHLMVAVTGVGLIAAVLIATAVLGSRPSAEPATPTEVAKAWLDAFQDGELHAAADLSCASFRTELSDPEILHWTSLSDGWWKFLPEHVNGDKVEIEVVKRFDGTARLFTLVREDGKWRVCGAFDPMPHH